MIRLSDIFPPGWLDLFSEHPRIGLGLDPATTTKAKSNPTGLVAVQQVGRMNYARLSLRFKTDDPDVTKGAIRLVLDGLRARGFSARRLCILATNERFFAVQCRKDFAGKVPTELVIESEKTKYLGEEMLMKAYLGNLLVNTIDDGYLALAPAEFVKMDFRQVVRDRGTFDAEVAEDGGHADLFGATAAALHAVIAQGGPVTASAAQVGTYGAPKAAAAGRILHNKAEQRALMRPRHAI